MRDYSISIATGKVKPLRSPRVFDLSAGGVQDHTKKVVQKSREAVARSRDLISKSREAIAAITKRRTG